MKISENISLDFHHNVIARKTSCIINIGNTQVIGIADCSKKDNFSRITGRKISLQRAMSKVINHNLLNKEDRRKIWYKYLSSCKIK